MRIISRALGEEFGFVGRWVAGVAVFALVAGFLARVIPSGWAAGVGVVAGLATVDLLKRCRDEVGR